MRKNSEMLAIELKALKTKVCDPEDVIPCILYCKTRTGEKLTQQILLCGMIAPTSTELTKFIGDVETVVNEKILGMIDCHWRDLGQ